MNRFLAALKTATKKTGHVFVDVAEVALPLATEAAPLAFPELSLPLSVVNSALGVSSMNPLEAMAISIILGVVQTTIKNPKSKAAVESQLVGLANSIYAEYGMVPPAAPTASGTTTA